ncbi:hypothetical protein SAMN05421688_3132 [Poseidonocella pacifica]|uniref:DUF6473 domain-containing protein n=1 Tax=Poseidonocella pacifica TaxID=871651 RepID=A0A1I0YL89_9RHOB|nr:DUF6473 family protein [Poseidonocella pacifica]SFB13068.1 hypothetical protein SAMN05421688_3132 [Poseidonocella pacifica]
MSFASPGPGDLDYELCRYDGCRVDLRGPRKLSEVGDYAVCLGAGETFGTFVAHPWPALLEERTGLSCFNLGVPHAGCDVFLGDPGLRRLCGGARLAVVQIMGAQGNSNCFYSVHRRRNDRFLQASPLMRTVFPDHDFTGFSFVRHMLGVLHHEAPEPFERLRKELQTVWTTRMSELIGAFDCPVVLLDMRRAARDQGALGSEPLFVTEEMVAEVALLANDLIEVPATTEPEAEHLTGLIFPPLQRSAAATIPGTSAHHAAAKALAEPVRSYVLSKRT